MQAMKFLSNSEACWLSRRWLWGGLAKRGGHSESQLGGKSLSCDTLRGFDFIFAGWMREIFHLEVLHLPFHGVTHSGTWLSTRACTRMHTHAHTCHHWCSWEALSYHDWAFILEEQDGGKFLVNLPALEEEALQLSLQEDKVSLTSLQKEMAHSWQQYPTALRLQIGNLNFWIFSVMTEAPPLTQTLPNTKILLES